MHPTRGWRMTGSAFAARDVLLAIGSAGYIPLGRGRSGGGSRPIAPGGTAGGFMLGGFWIPRGLQNAAKRPARRLLRSKTRQDAAKTPQDGPKRPQKTAKITFNTPPRPPNTSTRGFQMPPRRPKMPPRRGQDAPRRSQDASKRPPEAPRLPQDVQNLPKWSQIGTKIASQIDLNLKTVKSQRIL